MRAFAMTARRAALLVLAALLAVLGGCKKKDNALHILCYPAAVPDAISRKFGEESGLKIVVDRCASLEEFRAKLASSERPYDVLSCGEGEIRRLAAAGALSELDDVPNGRYLDPEFRDMAFDPGGKHSVPWMAEPVGIVYNAETIVAPVTGYADVFLPEHAKRIVAPAEVSDLAACATAAARRAGTATDLAAAEPVLREWIAKVKVFDSRRPGSTVEEGDADIGIVPGSEAARLFAANPRFQWVVPAEGFHLRLDCLAVPEKSGDKESAQRFINFVLRPENAKAIADAVPGYCPQAEARELLSPEQRNNPASYPQGTKITAGWLSPELDENAEKALEALKPNPLGATEETGTGD